MTKQDRLYLNELSCKVFGKSSIWQKIYKKGEFSTLTENLEDGTERKYKGFKYPTLEEIREQLELRWKEKQEEEAQKGMEIK